MIVEKEKPVWFDYLVMDDDLNQMLSEDAPEDVKEAYEQHLQEVSRQSAQGVFIEKANGGRVLHK